MYSHYQNTSMFLSRTPNRTLKKPNERSKSNRSNDQKQHSERQNPVFPFMKIFLSKRQRDIRQAIAYRYNKSKIRQYNYPNKRQYQNSMSKSIRSSRSSQIKQYKQLKGKTFVSLKDYHIKQTNFRPQQSSRSKNLLRIKLRSNHSRLLKTQGDQIQSHSQQKQKKSPYYAFLSGVNSTKHKKQPVPFERDLATIQFKQQHTRSIDTKGNIKSQRIAQNQATLSAKRRQLKNSGKQQTGLGTPKGNHTLKQNFVKP